MAETKRVILIGAGHAHLYAIKRAGEFARRGHELVVVAPGAFWYSGLATGMLGGVYPPAADRIDIDVLLSRNGRFIEDMLIGLDAPARSVTLRQSGAMECDAISINVGSEVPPILGAGADCYSVKPIRQLYELRRELERRFAENPERGVRVAIAGGGITAFEIGANIVELAIRCRGRANVVIYTETNEPLKQLPRSAADHRRPCGPPSSYSVPQFACDTCGRRASPISAATPVLGHHDIGARSRSGGTWFVLVVWAHGLSAQRLDRPRLCGQISNHWNVNRGDLAMVSVSA